MQLAKTNTSVKVAARLLPLVTIPDCDECPALVHCSLACTGFKNLYNKRRVKK